MSRLEAVLRTEAATEARRAGAGEILVTCDREITRAQVEARDVFIEAVLRVEASGRPRVAVDPA